MWRRGLSRLKLLTAKTILRSDVGRQLLTRRLARAKDPSGHPFDKVHRTETSGFVPSYLLSGYPVKSLIGNEVSPYFGCQPECARKAIGQVPDPGRFRFYDLGCGMGRATIIASEFPFEAIVGIEISPELCGIAERNAQTIRRLYPDRCPIEIVNADVVDFEIAAGHTVAFLYHPFGPDILGAVLARLEALASGGFDVIVIYENPVHFEVFDGSGDFGRCFGAQLACGADERPYLLDVDEAVVIWRSSGLGTVLPPQQFAIVTTKPGWRVEVKPAGP